MEFEGSMFPRGQHTGRERGRRGVAQRRSIAEDAWGEPWPTRGILGRAAPEQRPWSPREPPARGEALGPAGRARSPGLHAAVAVLEGAGASGRLRTTSLPASWAVSPSVEPDLGRVSPCPPQPEAIPVFTRKCTAKEPTLPALSSSPRIKSSLKSSL